MKKPVVHFPETFPDLYPMKAVDEAGRPLYRNLRPFAVDINEERHWIPARFVTDGASVPRAFWGLFPPHHPDYAAATLLHDWAYGGQLWPRSYADSLFLHAMIALDVGKVTRQTMYRAVQWFGGGAYKKNSPAHVAWVRGLSGVRESQIPLAAAGEPLQCTACGL